MALQIISRGLYNARKILPATRTDIFLSIGTIQFDPNSRRHLNPNDDMFLGTDLMIKMKTELVSRLNSVKLLNIELGTLNLLVEKVRFLGKYLKSHNFKFPERGPSSGIKTETCSYILLPVYVHFNSSLLPLSATYVLFASSLPFPLAVSD